VEQSAEAPHDHEDLIVVALAHSIRLLDLPIALFDDLLSAFEQDTMTTRYASWAEVFEYCRRSANPVGRLVLLIAGYRDDTLARSSDALCTALQLTNFWQDFGRDWHAGRVYVPRDVQQKFGALEEDLARGTMSAGWTSALGECVAVSAGQFAQGRTVCDGVAGRLRLESRVTWLGGQRILERVDQMRGDLLMSRPTLHRADVPVILWRAVRWQRA
jgi:squalene synthase HpnC